jgi:hypothetical protein
MHSLKLMVPTYNANLFPDQVANREMLEFGEPLTPVLVREADGLRIVLGSLDYDDLSKPDVKIERQPNGWAIFLHPVGESDPCGIVYFRDDGRSYLLKEGSYGAIPPIETLEPGSDVPGFHKNEVFS